LPVDAAVTAAERKFEDEFLAGLLQDPDAVLNDQGIAKKGKTMKPAANSEQHEKDSGLAIVTDIMATDVPIAKAGYGSETSQPDQVRFAFPLDRM